MTRSVQGSTDLAMPSPCVVWNVSICIMSYIAQGLKERTQFVIVGVEECL